MHEKLAGIWNNIEFRIITGCGLLGLAVGAFAVANGVNTAILGGASVFGMLIGSAVVNTRRQQQKAQALAAQTQVARQETFTLEDVMGRLSEDFARNARDREWINQQYANIEQWRTYITQKEAELSEREAAVAAAEKGASA